MSHIEISVRPEDDLSFVTVSGTASTGELAETIEAYYQGTVTRLAVWDLREAELGGISSDGVRQLTELSRTFVGRRPGGKTALVFATAADYGMGRMYEIQRASDDPDDVRYGVFRDMDQALEWLTE